MALIRAFARRVLARNLAAALVVTVVVSAALVVLRDAGALERIDLVLHDKLVLATTPAGADDRIAVVLESEADLARWGFPLSDDVLANLIERLAAAQPMAIAIDKYRDRPVAPGTERLDALLAHEERVYWVEKFGAAASEGIPAPAAVGPQRVGCGDLVDDPDGNVRRALLYLDHGERICYSLAFQLARHAAKARGIEARFATDAAAALEFGRASMRPVDPGDGPYATIDAAGFQVASPTAAGLPAFATFALSDVLEGRVPAEKLRGRLVLFGSGADSLRDYFNIPASSAPEGHQKVMGVQLHALFASYLLRAATGETLALQLLPAAATNAICVFLAVAGALVACSRKRPLMVLAAAVGLFVLYASFAFALAARGIHFAVAAPALALALAVAAGIARSAWLEARERAQLMTIFSRHVSREIADTLWARRDDFIADGVIMPRSIVATVLFLDIRSFTTTTEQLPAERAVPWLNRGLAVMTDAIMLHQGVVARFMGDAIMAVFGAPIPRATEAEHAADAFNAISAGLAIGPALDGLNREFAAEGLPPIRVRVGINTGAMTQCSIGTSRRMDFTVLGDSVNTAARLESFSMTDDGSTARVLIGELTMSLAGGRFETRHVGSMPLKGKEVPVTIHQVLSVRQPSGGSR